MSTKTISDEGESPEQKVQRQGKDDDEEVVDAVAVVGKIPASLLQSDDDNDGSNDSGDEIDSDMKGNNKSPVEFDDGDDDDDDDGDDGGNTDDEEGNEDDQDDDIVLADEEDDNDGEGDVSADDSGSASDAEPAAASPSVMPRKSKTNNSASSYATTVVVPPVAATQKKRGKVKVKYAKRPKDFPKRPLSAYNIFFRETRKAMLVEKQNQLHTEGKYEINFQTTVKEIARRWRALPAEKRGRVERIAKEDFARYKKEVCVFKDKARRLILREAIEQEKKRSQAEEEQKKNAIEKAATKAARGKQQEERNFSNRRAAAAPPPPSPPHGRSSGSSRGLPTAAAGLCLTMDYQRLPQDGDQFGSSAAGVDGDAAVTPARTINELCRLLEEDLLHIEAVREMKLRQLAELQVGIVPTNFLGGGGHPYDGLGSSLSPTTNHDPPPPRVTGRIAAALGRERDVSTISEAVPEVELLGHRQLQEPEREASLLLSYGGLADGDAALVGGSNIRGSAALRASRACLMELGLLGGGGGGGVAGVPGHPSYANPHSGVQFSAPLTRRRNGQEESIATAPYQDCVRAPSSQQDRLARQQQEDELLWRKIQGKKRNFLMSASSLTKEGLAGGSAGRGRNDAANQYDKQLKEYQQQLREYEVQHELELRHRGGTGIEFQRRRVALEQQDELLVRLEQEESVRREHKQQESLVHRRMVGGGGGDQHHHHVELLRKGYHGHLGGASPLMDSHYVSLNSSDDTIAEEEQRDRKRRRRRCREEEEHEVAAAAYQQQRLQELGDHYRRYEVRGVAATSSQHQERNYDDY